MAAFGQSDGIETVFVGGGSLPCGQVIDGGIDERLTAGVFHIAAYGEPPLANGRVNGLIGRLRGFALLQNHITPIAAPTDTGALKERRQCFLERQSPQRWALIGLINNDFGIVNEINMVGGMNPLHLFLQAALRRIGPQRGREEQKTAQKQDHLGLHILYNCFLIAYHYPYDGSMRQIPHSSGCLIYQSCKNKKEQRLFSIAIM